MATRVTPPVPTRLSRGVHNDRYKIVSEASAATRHLAKFRAKTRAERMLRNVRDAFARMGATYPPGGVGFGPTVVAYNAGTTFTGPVAYVIAKHRIDVTVMYARR